LKTATTVTRMTNQNTPTAMPDSTLTFWPVLSSMRVLTLSMPSSRRVPARSATATSQPTAMISSAKNIAGNCWPSVVCIEVMSAENSMVPSQETSDR
jgi:hypothetical protein